MHSKGPITFAFLSLIADWGALLAALFLSFWLRFQSGLIAVPLGIPPFRTYVIGLLIASVGWVALFAFMGLYDTRRGLTRADEILLVLKGTVLGTLFTMSAGFLYRGVSFSRLYLTIAIPFAFVIVTLVRLGLRRFRAHMRNRGFGVQRVLLVGGGRIAEEVRRRIERRPDLGYRLMGIVTPDRLDAPEGLPLVGSIDEIEAICRNNRIDRLFLALPEDHRDRAVEVVKACEKLPLDFEIVPDLFSRMGERMRLSEIDGIPLLGVKGYPLESWNRFLKRSFDIVVASLLLVLFAPLLLLIGLLIRIDSRGPVFYVQTRIGRDGRVFRILKFRSMIVNAEAASGPVWSGKGDTRLTRVGGFLRRTSLDELPQLVNVVAGQMSLVGPRPERPYFVKQFEERVPRYFDRHRVKSGMTGWAQVNGLRGDTSIEERTRYDVFYVENWSILFDVRILALTFRHVIRHSAGNEH